MLIMVYSLIKPIPGTDTDPSVSLDLIIFTGNTQGADGTHLLVITLGAVKLLDSSVRLCVTCGKSG